MAEYTLGQIGEKLQEPTTRISYIISKLRLKPIRRVGIYRLFGEEQVEVIKEGLYNIQVRK